MPKLQPLRLRTWQWAALALAAAAVLLVAWGGPDRAVAALVRQLDPAALAILGSAAQLGHSSWWLIPAGTLLVLLLAVRRRIVRARLRDACDWIAGLSAFVFAAVAVSGLTVDLVKWLVGRTRPNLVESGVAYGFDPFRFDAAYQSFPSGHASTLIALALVGGFVLPRLAVPLLALGAFLALGRVASSAHYVSDLIGAAAIAVAVTFWLRGRFAAHGWVFADDGSGPRVNRHGRMLGRWLARRLRAGTGWRGASRPAALPAAAAPGAVSRGRG